MQAFCLFFCVKNGSNTEDSDSFNTSRKRFPAYVRIIHLSKITEKKLDSHKSGAKANITKQMSRKELIYRKNLISITSAGKEIKVNIRRMEFYYFVAKLSLGAFIVFYVQNMIQNISNNRLFKSNVNRNFEQYKFDITENVARFMLFCLFIIQIPNKFKSQHLFS